MIKIKTLKKDGADFKRKIKDFERSNTTIMDRIIVLCVIQIIGLLALLLILF
jgi:hypothetical protein